jgi:hypothetical protein
MDKASGTRSYASVGDVMLRTDAKESLPNAFGSADVFGRTRDRGFSEIRYMGLNSAKQPVFRRRDVEILTNETTLTRGGGSSTVMAQSSGGNAFVSGFSSTPQPEIIQPLPADTTEFPVDLSKGRTITIRDHTIEIIEATAAGVTFIPR